MEGCRPADPGDIPRVVELAQMLRGEIREIRGGPTWALKEGRPEPLAEQYQTLIDDSDALVLVGTIDDAVIGFAVGEIDRLHDGRVLGVVSDLYVEPEAREIGVGETMTDTLLDFFRTRGCVGVDAWALPGHRMTKNFFEDQGFVSRGIVVHRSLEG